MIFFFNFKFLNYFYFYSYSFSLFSPLKNTVKIDPCERRERKGEDNWMVTVVSVMVISQGDSSKLNTDSYLVNCRVHLTYECENHSVAKFLITQGPRSPVR